MISLLLPTRGRPALARRFLDSVAQLSHDLTHIEVVMYVNEDDVESHTLTHDRVGIRLIIGPAATMGTYNTECLARATGRIVMLINDDVLMRTHAWDEHVRELDRAFKDGIYLGYGNDLFKGRRISTFPILSRRTCEVLVAPFPSEYRGSLIDYHLFDTFKRLERMGHDRIRYMEHVVFEHLHYRTGKTPFDATYARRHRFGDDGTFAGLRSQRQASARRLAAAIDGKVLQSLPEPPAGFEAPKTIRRVLGGYARTFLGDSGLPWAWRLFLFAWYCGRHLAARGYRP